MQKALVWSLVRERDPTCNNKDPEQPNKQIFFIKKKEKTKKEEKRNKEVPTSETHVSMLRDPETYPDKSLTWLSICEMQPLTNSNDLSASPDTETQVNLKIRAESNQPLIKRDSNEIKKNFILQAFSKHLIVCYLNSGL